jgi:DNA polymerase-4
MIRSIFHEYTDLVEPLSLDEAFLDVTEVKKGPASASLIAMEIKKEIQQQTNLIASAGVSYNKFLAKIASDMDKPDGFYLIKPEDAESFLEDLDVGLFFGVGEKTKQKMHQMNIFKGSDLKLLPLPDMVKHFGKAGSYFYNAVRGIDERLVVSHRERKSIGAERTFETDLTDLAEVNEKLTDIVDIMWSRCEAKQKTGKTLTLKLRFADFSTITRSNTSHMAYTKTAIDSAVQHLLPVKDIQEQGIRLLGVTISNFQDEKQPSSKQLKIDFF